MADTRIPLVTADKDGKPDLKSLNEIIRQIFQAITYLEGRSGEIEIRDQMNLNAPLKLEAFEDDAKEEDVAKLLLGGDLEITSDKPAGEEIKAIVRGNGNIVLGQGLVNRQGSTGFVYFPRVGEDVPGGTPVEEGTTIPLVLFIDLTNVYLYAYHPTTASWQRVTFS